MVDEACACDDENSPLYDPIECDDQDIVYRNPGAGQHPSCRLTGFHPKNPNATYAPAYHIARGSDPNVRTQFISLTRSLYVARARQTPGIPIYEINLNAVIGKVYDFTVPSEVERYLKHPIPRNLAIASQEVLVEGWIPPVAIIRVIPYP
jgi:hypothetical protein